MKYFFASAENIVDFFYNYKYAYDSDGKYYGIPEWKFFFRFCICKVW